MNNIFPEISIITINYNSAEIILESLRRTLKVLSGISYEVLVVDNCSTDDSFQTLHDALANEQRVRVIRSAKNGGFGYGCNIGAANAKAKLLWFLNSDAWVEDIRGFQDLLDLCRKEKVGLVGTSVELESGEATPQGGGDMSFTFFLLSSLRLGRLFRATPKFFQKIISLVFKRSKLISRYTESLHHSKSSFVYASPGVGGASFIIRSTLFQEVGGFDAGFFLYDEDGDLCLRLLEKGKKNFISPSVTVRTIGSATTSKLPSLKLKLIKLHSRRLLIDKHFSGLRKLVLILVTYITFWLL